MLKDIHDRMPVVIEKKDYDLWLDPGMTDPVKLADLLKSFDSRNMRIYPVSSAVNSVKNDVPECAEEVTVDDESSSQGNLF